jgi:hypothetical protein
VETSKPTPKPWFPCARSQRHVASSELAVAWKTATLGTHGTIAQMFLLGPLARVLQASMIRSQGAAGRERQDRGGGARPVWVRDAVAPANPTRPTHAVLAFQLWRWTGSSPVLAIK